MKKDVIYSSDNPLSAAALPSSMEVQNVAERHWVPAKQELPIG